MSRMDAAVRAPGDPLPWLIVQAAGGQPFALSGAAGRPVAFSCPGSVGHPAVGALLRGFEAEAELFDGQAARLFLVSQDPADAAPGRAPPDRPGRQLILDLDRRLGEALGLFVAVAGAPTRLVAVTWVFDAALRAVARLPITHPATHAAEVAAVLRRLAAPPAFCAPVGLAPVLLLPRVLEPALCADLIRYWEAGRPEPTGVMENLADGGARMVVDGARKRRRDLLITEPLLRAAVHAAVVQRVIPAVALAFQFEATEVERYLLAAYEAEDQGWFGAHRDNQSQRTAHRRFACSISVGPDDYDGGDVSFPEHGPARYRAPQGAALVFSCALLHAVDPVTRGRRLCSLPFLYDEAGERLRRSMNGLGAAPAAG
jgi:predicted 2-oxoglutarate/Fe(II)-dependent dioxygenase YbiX